MNLFLKELLLSGAPVNFEQTRFPAWWGFINFLGYAGTRSSALFQWYGSSGKYHRQRAAAEIRCFGVNTTKYVIVFGCCWFGPNIPASPANRHRRKKLCKKESPCSERAPSWNSNANVDFTSAKSNLSNKMSSFSRGRKPLIRIHSSLVWPGCSVVTLPQADLEDFLLCCSCSEAAEHHLDRSGWNEIFIFMRRERCFELESLPVSVHPGRWLKLG